MQFLNYREHLLKDIDFYNTLITLVVTTYKNALSVLPKVSLMVLEFQKLSDNSNVIPISNINQQLR
jgi:hypothetical protein